MKRHAVKSLDRPRRTRPEADDHPATRKLIDGAEVLRQGARRAREDVHDRRAQLRPARFPREQRKPGKGIVVEPLVHPERVHAGFVGRPRQPQEGFRLARAPREVQRDLPCHRRALYQRTVPACAPALAYSLAQTLPEAPLIERAELAEGIRFAGKRAAAALEHVQDWDHQLAHAWTTADAFRHIAATAGGLQGFYPLLDAGVLDRYNVQAAAEGNARAIEGMKEKSRDELKQAILDGHEASAKFVESLDDADLAKVVTLGGYTMPKAEIVAQIWVHHAIAHAYEASARWPLL